ncbi:hypothetical protein ABPG75_013686 [Micractinium tetrahymenae]
MEEPFLQTGGILVACQAYDPDASGTEKPDPAAVQKLVEQICSSPEAAGQQIKTAIQAGGSQAQVAALALFQEASCSDKRATDTAYLAAVDAVNTGKASDLAATQQFFTQMISAANAVGVPMCLTIVAVDRGGRLVYGQWQYHTGSAV